MDKLEPPTTGPDEWAHSRVDGALLSCVQEAGDLAFVPKGMAHGVLNLAESVGFAIEFSWRHGPHQHGVELPDPAQ